MAGTFFEYFNGYLRIAFDRASYGDIYIDFSFHGDATAAISCDDSFVKGTPEITVGGDVAIRTWTSASVSHFFNSMIRWLEAVVCGVQECAFQWDGEGPEGELRWFGSFESGCLKLTWAEGYPDREARHETRLDRLQMVRAFYESFRAYAESDRYDPLDYEPLNVGEAIALVLDDGNLDVLADALASRSLDEARQLLSVLLAHAYDRDASYPRRLPLPAFIERAQNVMDAESPEDTWFTEEWHAWNEQQRRDFVLASVYPESAWYATGERLRELHSPLIEAWLAEHSDRPQPLRDTAS